MYPREASARRASRSAEGANPGLPAEAVREQLERLLASSQFSSSPRCQMLLRHVVEEALDGSVELLKERNLGIDVFKRDASYDTNANPVVRIAASEVRKKLAQYYFEPAHRSQIRIEIPIGSYVPAFSAPEVTAEPEPIEHTAPIPISTHPVVEQPLMKPVWQRREWLALLVVLVAGGVTAGAWFLIASRNPLDAFWGPLIRTSHPVMICTGQLRATQVELDPNPSRNPAGATMAFAIGKEAVDVPMMAVNDSITQANIAGYLRSRKSPFFVRSEELTSYEDLQRVPTVLVGGLNNDWTIRLMRNIRYQFVQDAADRTWWISDQEKPGVRLGTKKVDPTVPVTQDMAIVARLVDPETRQPLVVVAGITSEGTLAAGNFITDQDEWSEFAHAAPSGWQKRNIEILLSVNVIDGKPGPARVVGTSVW